MTSSTSIWISPMGMPLGVRVLLAVFFASFDQATTAANQGIAGLTQRVLVLAEFAWFAALGWFVSMAGRKSPLMAVPGQRWWPIESPRVIGLCWVSPPFGG